MGVFLQKIHNILKIKGKTREFVLWDAHFMRREGKNQLCLRNYVVSARFFSYLWELRLNSLPA